MKPPFLALPENIQIRTHKRCISKQIVRATEEPLASIQLHVLQFSCLFVLYEDERSDSLLTVHGVRLG